MYFEKLARSLRLPALAMCSVFLFACSDGDGPDEIVDPRFANCPGPNCVLNPVPPGPPPATANLLTNGSFEGASFIPWINAGFITAAPAPEGVNDYYTTNVTAAGAPFSWNLSQVLTAPALIDGDAYTLNFRAKADVPRSMLAGIGEDGGAFGSDTRTVALTTEWQGFSFDLVAPGNVSGDGGRVLFDMGAEIGRVDIDDVSVTPVADTANEHVTNGSFETGPGALPAPWENRGGAVGDGVIVEETGNDSVYNVNVLAAGAPFSVNLSQVITITPGLNYKLTFRARTDSTTVSRTMLAGLGLNEAPFTADARNTLLLDQWRSYTYNFTAVGFGNANSRVLFDMGAAEGIVYIDDVFVSIEP